MLRVVKNPLYNMSHLPKPCAAQKTPAAQGQEPTDDVQVNAARNANLALASSDPYIQAASKSLRKMFLAYAAAVSLDAKHPSAKTRNMVEAAETALQEAIELELVAARQASRDGCLSLELPQELLALRTS